jgi:MFS family permease
LSLPTAASFSGGGADAQREVDLSSLVSCILGNFLIRAAAAAAGTLISLYLASLQVNGHPVHARFVGLSAVLFYSAELIGSPGFGLLCDLRGRKPFMLLGPGLGAMAISLIALSPILVLVLVARFLQGLSTASSVPPTLSFLSAQTGYSETLRGRVMSIFEVVTIVGMAAGFASGGILWDRMGHSAFVPVVFVYAASLLLFWLVRDKFEPAASQPVSSTSGLADAGARQVRRTVASRFSILRSGSALKLVPAWIAVNAVVGLWFSHIDFQMAKTDDPLQFLVGGFSGSQIGIYTAVVAVLFTVGIGLWALTFGRLRATQIMVFSLVGLVTLVVVLFALNSTTQGQFVRANALLGAAGLALLVTSGFTPAALAYLAQIAEDYPESRGSLMGLYSVFLGLGQFLGGGLGGFFADWAGVNGMITFTGILAIVAGLFVYALIRAEDGHSRRAVSPVRVRGGLH